MSHSCGFYTVKDHQLTTHDGSMQTDSPAFVVDTGSGVVLKVGDKSMVKSYHALVACQFNSLFPDMTKDIVYMEWDPDGPMSLDEFCTLINMLNNHLGPVMTQEIVDPQNAEKTMLRIKSFEKFDF